MSNEIKDCPFCGKAAEQDYQQGYRTFTGSKLDHAAAIYCTSCNAHMTICRADTPELSDEERMAILVLNWNQRPMAVTPRGGVERNWWEEYQLLLRRFKKLAKAARQCVEEVDANLAKDDWPVKYRAPFDGLTKLREALPETYEQFKARKEPA